MAMTKEQQKEASDRIMGKFPLTEEERRTYEYLTMEPPYPQSGDKRVCGKCGASFRDDLNQKGEIVVPSLAKFTDHQAEHNPSPAQWAEAHNRIQLAKRSDT
jgi:hypothetical protein